MITILPASTPLQLDDRSSTASTDVCVRSVPDALCATPPFAMTLSDIQVAEATVACAETSEVRAATAGLLDRAVFVPNREATHAIFDIYFMSTRHIPVYFLKLYHDEVNKIRSKMERDGAIILRDRQQHLQILCRVGYIDQYKRWPEYRFIDRVGSYYIEWARLYPDSPLYVEYGAPCVPLLLDPPNVGPTAVEGAAVDDSAGLENWALVNDSSVQPSGDVQGST